MIHIVPEGREAKRTLFRRLIISFIAVMAITLVLIAVIFTSFSYRYFINSEEKELAARGVNLSRIISPHMYTRMDQISIEYLINSLEQVWSIRFWVTDKNGIIFAVSRGIYGDTNIQKGMKIDSEDLKIINEGKSTVKTGYTRYLGENAISIGIPVNSEDTGEFLGALFLSKPVINIREVNTNIIRLLIFAAFTSMLPALIIAYYLSRSISNPLSQMNRTAKAMVAGNYKRRIEVRKNDEIGQLGNSLNDLSGELDNTITELQNEKKKLELILTSLSEGMLAVDRDKKIIHYNRAFMELLDIRLITPDMIISAGNSDISENEGMRHEKYRWLANTIDEVLKYGVTEETDHITEKGLTIHAIVSPITDGSDETIGSVALLSDISETAKLEQLRQDYVANISHELRTPLTSIRGFIEPLIDGTVDDRNVIERYHEIIFRETLRLQRLINDLLDLSRLQSGNARIDMEPMDVGGIIVNVMTKLKLQSEKKDIKIIYEEEESIPKVMGNEDRIEQLLVILVDNAINYTQKGGTVRIRTEEVMDRAGADVNAVPGLKTEEIKERGYLKISVEDNGPGISPEDLRHIWERFYKVDKSRGSTGGTGLGLSIARHVAELMGGLVFASSTPGRGSVFAFTLKKAE
ncbi:MAG: ATP-binding protein [Eubacteriales bacterium]|nr:ATP-binding protein [Eubacteriales bacterium]